MQSSVRSREDRSCELMGAQGTASIDFGAFPGASDAAVAVTGQTGIVGGSLVEAWVFPAATADHTVDEHMVETFRVFAHDITPGSGFLISGFNTSQLNEPLCPVYGLTSGLAGSAPIGQGLQQPQQGGLGTRIYGVWNLAWVWN